MICPVILLLKMDLEHFLAHAAAICEIFQHDVTSLMYKAGLKLEGLHIGKRAQGFV